MAHTRKPTMAITMGDPAGIGPEITLKTIQDERIYDICNPFIIGSADSLEQAAEIQGVKDLNLNVITEPEQARNEFGTIDLLETGVEPDATIEFGAIQVAAAKRAYSYIEKSIELGMAAASTASPRPRSTRPPSRRPRCPTSATPRSTRRSPVRRTP